MVIDRRKRSKALNEVKPVENVSKNLVSFLGISPMQKEVPPCIRVTLREDKGLKEDNPLQRINRVTQVCFS